MSILEKEAARRFEQIEKGAEWLDKRATEKKRYPALTDVGNAERFIRQHGDDVRFVPEWGWLVWDRTRWVRDDLKVRNLAKRTMRRIHAEAAEVADKDEQAAIGQWARKSQSADRIKSALWVAQPDAAACTGDFDKEPWLLPCANGTVDLRTGDMHQHRREHMLTRLSPVYFDPSASCPAWLTFLERVLPDPELRAFVKRAAGYSLTGLTTEQKLFFPYGCGRNGKTVFLETLAALMGDFHSATRVETISVTRSGGIPNDVAALAGARLVTVSETPEGVRMNESLVKDMTGGNTMQARFLRHEFFEFQPQFKLWIQGNHKPQIRGTDDGIWRRLLLIPFTVQIPLEEVDPELPERLLGELPGILAWAVAGCLEWQAKGLNPPSAITEAVAEYRNEMDVVGEFLAECCVTTPDAYASASDLYGAYKRWSEECGHFPVSMTRFGTGLGERGFTKEKRGTIYWRGVGLLDSGHLDSLDHFRSSSYSRAHNPDKPETGSNCPTVQKADCSRCGGDGCAWCERPF